MKEREKVLTSIFFCSIFVSNSVNCFSTRFLLTLRKRFVSVLHFLDLTPKQKVAVKVFTPSVQLAKYGSYRCYRQYVTLHYSIDQLLPSSPLLSINGLNQQDVDVPRDRKSLQPLQTDKNSSHFAPNQFQPVIHVCFGFCLILLQQHRTDQFVNRVGGDESGKLLLHTLIFTLLSI